MVVFSVASAVTVVFVVLHVKSFLAYVLFCICIYIGVILPDIGCGDFMHLYIS